MAANRGRGLPGFGFGLFWSLSGGGPPTAQAGNLRGIAYGFLGSGRTHGSEPLGQPGNLRSLSFGFLGGGSAHGGTAAAPTPLTERGIARGVYRGVGRGV